MSVVPYAFTKLIRFTNKLDKAKLDKFMRKMLTRGHELLSVNSAVKCCTLSSFMSLYLLVCAGEKLVTRLK